MPKIEPLRPGDAPLPVLDKEGFMTRVLLRPLLLLLLLDTAVSAATDSHPLRLPSRDAFGNLVRGLILTKDEHFEGLKGDMSYDPIWDDPGQHVWKMQPVIEGCRDPERAVFIQSFGKTQALVVLARASAADTAGVARVVSDYATARTWLLKDAVGWEVAEDIAAQDGNFPSLTLSQVGREGREPHLSLRLNWRHKSLRLCLGLSIRGVLLPGGQTRMAPVPLVEPVPVERPALLPDTRLREVIGTLRDEVLRGLPSVVVKGKRPEPGSYNGVPVQRPVLTAPGAPELKGHLDDYGKGVVVAWLPLASVDDPNPQQRLGFELAFRHLRALILDEVPDWRVDDHFAPGEAYTPDTRMAEATFSSGLPASPCLQAWLIKRDPPPGNDSYMFSRWTLELAVRADTEPRGVTAADLRKLLAGGQKPELSTFATWLADSATISSNDVVLAIDGTPTAKAPSEVLRRAMKGLPARRTSILAVAHGGLPALVTARVAGAGPGMIEALDADLRRADYSEKVLFDFDWRAFARVVHEMTVPDTVESWAQGLPDATGRFHLRPNPLSRSRNLDWQEMHIDGTSVVVTIVIHRCPDRAPRRRQSLLGNLVWEACRGEGLDRSSFDADVDLYEDRRQDETRYGLTLTVHAPRVAAALSRRFALSLSPVSGDCRNGWGKARLTDSGEMYEGLFQDGLPAGPGRRWTPGKPGVLVANFRGQYPDGPGILFDPVAGKAVRGRYEGGKLTLKVALPTVGKPGEGFKTLDGLERGPIVVWRGKLLDGDTKDGMCRLQIPGWGTYQGQFVLGVAQGQGVLDDLNGRIYLLDCLDGIPSLVRTLAIPDGQRLACFRASDPNLFPRGDGLQGNCRNGDGLAFLDIRDGHPRLYHGPFLHGMPEGKGRIETDGKSEEATFRDGRRTDVFEDPEAALSLLERATRNFVPAPQRKEESEPKTTGPLPPTGNPEHPVTICKACGGTGVLVRRGYNVDEVEVVPFMPGDRHYGSWVFSGYSHRTGRKVHIPDQVYRCPYCGGTGVIHW